jgi:hypothetical protein
MYMPGINRNGARTLAKQYDPSGISPESCNVVVHPWHSSVQVKKTKILGVRLTSKLRSVRLTEEVSSIVERYDQYIITVLDEVLAIIYDEVTLQNMFKG